MGRRAGQTGLGRDAIINPYDAQRILFGNGRSCTALRGRDRRAGRRRGNARRSPCPACCSMPRWTAAPPASTRAIAAGRRNSCTECSVAAHGSTRCSATGCAADSSRLDPDLTDLLRLGAHQLFHMGSVPPYAAIAQTVELAKQRHGIGASELVNAVLRRLDRERDDLARGSSRRSDRRARAEIFASALARRAVGRAVWRRLKRPRCWTRTTIRLRSIIRPFGVVREQLEAMLEASGVAVDDAPLARDSLVIGGGVGLRDLGAFQQGLFFVQDPAATLVTQYAAFPASARVADLCAAPGGKAVELSRSAELVVAADASFARLARLRETISRLELRNVLPRRQRRPCNGDRAGRRGARGRAVHRHRHFSPASRRAVAPRRRTTSRCSRQRSVRSCTRPPHPSRPGGCWCTAPARSRPRRTTPRWRHSSRPIPSSRSSRRRRERCRRRCSMRAACAFCRSATAPMASFAARMRRRSA